MIRWVSLITKSIRWTAFALYIKRIEPIGPKTFSFIPNHTSKLEKTHFQWNYFIFSWWQISCWNHLQSVCVQWLKIHVDEFRNGWRREISMDISTIIVTERVCENQNPRQGFPENQSLAIYWWIQGIIPCESPKKRINNFHFSHALSNCTLIQHNGKFKRRGIDCGEHENGLYEMLTGKSFSQSK